MFVGQSTAFGKSAFISLRSCFVSATDARHTPGAPIRRSEIFARTGTGHPSESNISGDSVEDLLGDFFALTSFHSVAGRTLFDGRSCGVSSTFEAGDARIIDVMPVDTDVALGIKDDNAPERSNNKSCGTI